MAGQIEQATAEYKKGVEGIQTEITGKEDLLAEIAKLENQRDAIENDLQAVDLILSDQRRENQELREKIEEANQEIRVKESLDKKVNTVFFDLLIMSCKEKTAIWVFEKAYSRKEQWDYRALKSW